MKYFESRRIILVALVSQLFIGSISFTGVANHWFGMKMNIAFLFFILLCIGFTSPNGIALALAPIHKDMGTASALVGMIRIGIAGFASATVGFLKVTNSIPVAGMITITSAMDCW